MTGARMSGRLFCSNSIHTNIMRLVFGRFLCAYLQIGENDGKFLPVGEFLGVGENLRRKNVM